MTRQVTAGNVKIGGDAPISVQSMLNVPANDIEGSVKQAIALENAGCEIIRAAVPDMSAVKLIDALKNAVKVPIVCDIHFDWRLAIECVAAGVDKVRINPGNIGSADRIKAVADACRNKNIPIRIGINSGSCEKDVLNKYGHPCAEALAESAIKNARMLEKYDFNDIVLSVKSSNVQENYKANILLSQNTDYPLHLGVTEAGTERSGIIKSSAGIGGLLLNGIGNTIRVSLTANPVKEVETAKTLLKVLGLRKGGVEIVSCPTCGRTQIDLIGLANRVEEALLSHDLDIKVAIMGCIVNGPGEAKEADLGIAGGDGCGVVFKKGQVIRKVSEDMLFPALMEEIEKYERS
ncbi:MAG: flavodoxin-dependent (E)-4-hydroxy-3-methylbut-2-enyl-diphosphate synthase [Clostridia bacterium]|nr:flavodoxin-dependent (E)-4-hydroxy-3-methylbut-2-enyl-diphosphate synthase [Clostridia bacterium]